MKRIIKNVVRWLFILCLLLWCGYILVDFAKVEAAQNDVPDYYYADYRFADSWENIWDTFKEIQSRYDLGKEVDQSLFIKLNNYFNNSFPYLTKDFDTVYQKCSILASELSQRYSYSDLKALLWTSCYKSLSDTAGKITSLYTVQANATANPAAWTAPLTVTFDARWSIDPSSETIPKDNFFRYYRDENGVDTPMWKWNVINYEFKEAWNFIVHLVVRSSNVDKWILDGSRDITVNVSPKAANIVVYANTRRMQQNSPLKIWTTEGQKWIVFDGSATMPKWWRKIESHRWIITNSAIWFSKSESGNGSPSYINVPLNGNWEYKVTLSTTDNEKNTVSETFSLIISDPVTVIKQSPAKWTTSSLYTFDGGASYSITNKLDTYVREIFNEEWNKIKTEQGKTMSHRFTIPWNYLIRLTVTDLLWQRNIDIKEILVESTTPTPQFTTTPTKRWTKPSEFTLDASNSSDVDILNWADSLEYEWSFSTNKYKIVSTENNNEKIVVQFDEKWKHTVMLTVTDQYWKSATISKTIEVLSVLRPEIEPNPWAISWGRSLNFNSKINEPVDSYSWDFWDKKTLSNKDALSVDHIYAQKWVYEVKLSVDSYDLDDSNTVTERVFIWEVDYPIAAYKVRDSQWFLLQASESCKIEWAEWYEPAYEIDRYAKVTIDPSISVNTQWKSIWLESAYEREWWTKSDKKLFSFTNAFKEVWCKYIDLAIYDSNSWKQDKTRIWFNVKNASPVVKNVTLSFPQYSENSNAVWSIWFWSSNTKSTFDCSWTNNLTVRVSAVNASDPDGTISRLRFYYYNVDDPDRILEYKDSFVTSPYAYFVIPRVTWEYKFWVMVYDNDWWMTDSDEYLWSSPSVYFPAVCDWSDIPTVTLKLSSTSVEVWDTVTYSIVSKIDSGNEDFETSRTFYYDFTWDGVRDLVTKKSSATYTFTEAYEEWIQPRAAVEYRNRLWKWDGAKIIVKNWIKPILLFNAHKNVVIFRDLSVWVFQQRELCFEKQECDLWNKRFRKTNIVTSNIESITWWTDTSITQNDSFLWKYSDFWKHDVSLYLKSKFWITEDVVYEVNTSNSAKNGRIASWINMISIPETTFNNSIPEIFLSKAMKNTLLLYIANETEDDQCFVDTDISKDSDWDGKTDNDRDLGCNMMWKIYYEPNYESVIWRIYFINNGQLVFQNFSISFEWYVLEYSEDDLAIYNDITLLVNWIDDTLWENASLKSSLDVLRKNLWNRNLVSSTVMTIKSQISEWWINLDSKQRDLLNDVLNRLSNEDTIVAVWMNPYEKNKQEILAILSSSYRDEIEQMFNVFEQNADSYDPETKSQELKNIFTMIQKRGWETSSLDRDDILAVVQPSFCAIFDYYEIATYSQSCISWQESEILKNYESVDSTSQVSNKKWFPVRLKIILFVLWGWVLIMWWIILFFALKARKNNIEDEDE